MMKSKDMLKKYFGKNLKASNVECASDIKIDILSIHALGIKNKKGKLYACSILQTMG